MKISKLDIVQACNSEIESRISNTQLAIKSAQESANSEQKSTAGDKHDTARAMAQFEQEKLSKHLAEQMKLKALMPKLSTKEGHKKVQLGSLVETSSGVFFIGPGLGKLEIKKQQIFAISAASPLGQKLIGLELNDSYSINNRTFNILKLI